MMVYPWKSRLLQLAMLPMMNSQYNHELYTWTVLVSFLGFSWSTTFAEAPNVEKFWGSWRLENYFTSMRASSPSLSLSRGGQIVHKLTWKIFLMPLVTWFQPLWVQFRLEASCRRFIFLPIALCVCVEGMLGRSEWLYRFIKRSCGGLKSVGVDHFSFLKMGNGIASVVCC